MPEPAPLILSAVLDAPVQRRLDALRRAHFPPDRNHLDAHVTLFHHLPGGRRTPSRRRSAAVRRALPAPPVDVTGVRLARPRGRGHARLARAGGGSAPDLAHAWGSWLTAQDRTKRDLHVTVQNKVTPQEARGLLSELSRRRSFPSARGRSRSRCGATAAVPGNRSRGSRSPGKNAAPEAVPRADVRVPAGAIGRHREPMMTTPRPEPTVLDVAESSRFEIHVDGRLAGFAQYRMKDPGLIVFTHTEIDDAFEGRGLGSTLIRAALDAARGRGLAVRPDCPFVRAYIAPPPRLPRPRARRPPRPRLGLLT